MRWSEVWLINLDPSIGAEIRKTRPTVIVNDDAIGALPLRVKSVGRALALVMRLGHG